VGCISGLGAFLLIEVDEIMADEVALMEEAELEALASMNSERAPQTGQQDIPPEDEMDEMDSLLFSTDGQAATAYASQDQPGSETPYGSDEDEYDHIFMDVIQQEGRMASQQSQPSAGDHDMMDMS
jgi:hypothetical protein